VRRLPVASCAGDAMTDKTKPKGHPHIRKPKPGHPWKAFAACARDKNRRDADAKQTTTKRKVPK